MGGARKRDEGEPRTKYGKERSRWIARRAASAVEEPALQKRKNLLARERLGVGRKAIAFEHADVVLESLVRPQKGILELVAFEDHVLGPRLVGLAELRIDDPADHPDRPGAALDPNRDLLLGAHVVYAYQRAFGIPALA